MTQINFNIKAMKPLILGIIISSIIMGCQTPNEQSNDLEALKSELAEKKSSFAALRSEIAELESQIAAIEPAPKKKTSLVTIDTLKKMTIDRYATLQGSVMSDEQANATSEIPGRITSVRVKEGDPVRKGQLIATIDTEVLEDQMLEIQTRLDLAITIFEKQEKLWKQNIGSELQYLQAKNNKEALEQSYKTMQTQLTKKNVYAPVSGVVDMEILKSGEMASPGVPIVTILNTNKLKVVADVPEHYLTSVKKGDNVAITFPALDKEINRKVTLIGRSIDPSNRTFKIEMNTDHLNGMLKPNLLSEVKIKELTLKDVLAIPIELIQQEVDGKEYVFIAEKQGDDLVAKKAYVQKGETANGMVAITSGLNPEDLVIKLGARTVSEGDIVINEKG